MSKTGHTEVQNGPTIVQNGPWPLLQEIWANAHETRDSIGVVTLWISVQHILNGVPKFMDSPRDWRRRAGRPRQSWLRTVEADLRPMNLGLATAKRCAQDRSAWRLLVATATSSTSSWRRRTQIWRSRLEDCLKLGVETDRQNVRFMLKLSDAGCLRSIFIILAQFTVEICVAAWNREKFTNNLLFWISRSSMLVPPESLSALLVMISRTSVFICNCFHARLVDCSRNRTFWMGYPNLKPTIEDLQVVCCS